MYLWASLAAMSVKVQVQLCAACVGGEKREEKRTRTM